MSVTLPFNEPNALPLTTDRARKLQNLFRTGHPITKRLVASVAEMLERVDTGSLLVDFVETTNSENAVVGAQVIYPAAPFSDVREGWYVVHPSIPEGTTVTKVLETHVELSAALTNDIPGDDALLFLSPQAWAAYQLAKEAASLTLPLHLDLGEILPNGYFETTPFLVEGGSVTVTGEGATLPNLVDGRNVVGWYVHGPEWSVGTQVLEVGEGYIVMSFPALGSGNSLLHLSQSPLFICLVDDVFPEYDRTSGRDLLITGRVTPSKWFFSASPEIHISLPSTPPAETVKDSRVTIKIQTDDSAYDNAPFNLNLTVLSSHQGNDVNYLVGPIALRDNLALIPNQFQTTEVILKPYPGTGSYEVLLKTIPLAYVPSGVLPYPTHQDWGATVIGVEGSEKAFRTSATWDGVGSGGLLFLFYAPTDADFGYTAVLTPSDTTYAIEIYAAAQAQILEPGVWGVRLMGSPLLASPGLRTAEIFITQYKKA